MPKLEGLALTAAVLATLLVNSAHARSTACADPARIAGGPSNAHTIFIETNLLSAVLRNGTGPHTLRAHMRRYSVPGLSVAVIRDGKIDWARGWGVRDIDSCAPVTPATAFQAASISKIATAIIALRMVEQGKLRLDGNVNDALRSWKLPVNLALAPNGVTLRELLSHTAGLGVHGFAGYSPDSPLPSIVQILNGAPPSNSPAVRSERRTGAQFEYSGGGYVVAQLALSDVAGMPFDELAEHELLAPLHMTRSAFAQPPSLAIKADIASGHVNGRPLRGGYHVYPELAPAGLWTTATDLALLLTDLQASASGARGHRLSPTMTGAMLTRVKENWGMGAMLYGDRATRFGHDGVNEGFQSFAIADARKGHGVVVLTNGGQGRRLIDEIVRAVATDYGWLDLAVPATSEKRLSQRQLARAAGHFIGAGLDVVLQASRDGLVANPTSPQPERLVALSPRRFRSEVLGVTVEFAPDFASCTIIEGGPPMKLNRVQT